LLENYFIYFKTSIEGYQLPNKFTYPFYYQVHPLCLLAAKELQTYINTQQEWYHNFGLIDADDKSSVIGKMLGVLLVQNDNNEIGYLAAFSGKMAGKNHLPYFVPPVYDMLTEDSFFLSIQVNINQLTEQIQVLENNPQLVELRTVLTSETVASQVEIQAYRQIIINQRKKRKLQRTQAEKEISSADFLQLKDRLAQQSIEEKTVLKKLIAHWHQKIQQVENNLNYLINEILKLKNHRKKISAQLQKKIFQQYSFLNKEGIEKNLVDIFQQTSQKIPPAGAGECATPKLLHYAFQHQMKPLAMAEFWWGLSPKSEVRKHGVFYPACQGKCQPILQHMLEGIVMDENPLLTNLAVDKQIDIIYQDEVMLVINKPTDLLSVSGKNIKDSVYSRIKHCYPKATGGLIVHRLDMSTSGLMLIALSTLAHKNLQKQFIQRTIKKRYIALLEGLVNEDEGMIELPLRVDLNDRPRQLVCYEFGKAAKTQWQVIKRYNGRTKVVFYPMTGRTHQLRVHAAHVKGLNRAIVGDDLYGHTANRLYLHAESLEFQHPISKKWMYFQRDADF
jgi:tRNA pseudouridine32 synthase/23S rRNA pseudouridine746 synthase